MIESVVQQPAEYMFSCSCLLVPATRLSDEPPDARGDPAGMRAAAAAVFQGAAPAVQAHRYQARQDMGHRAQEHTNTRHAGTLQDYQDDG